MESRLVPLYLPEGVAKVIGFGSSSFIGQIDDETVLKYPRVPGEQWSRFEVEKTIYDALGTHPRIVSCLGLDERGLILEYASMGTVRDFLRRPISISPKKRLMWCRQASEALAHVHTRHVLHCDVSTRNLLLDGNLDVKLSDFQGTYNAPNGPSIYGFALENAKAFLPRPTNHSDQMSDLFALGTALYEIMTGHEPYPDLDELDDEEEIEKRYVEKRFPILDDVLGGQIIQRCWSLVYRSASHCVKDLVALERRFEMES